MKKIFIATFVFLFLAHFNQTQAASFLPSFEVADGKTLMSTAVSYDKEVKITSPKLSDKFVAGDKLEIAWDAQDPSRDITAVVYYFKSKTEAIPTLGGFLEVGIIRDVEKIEIDIPNDILSGYYQVVITDRLTGSSSKSPIFEIKSKYKSKKYLEKILNGIAKKQLAKLNAQAELAYRFNPTHATICTDISGIGAISYVTESLLGIKADCDSVKDAWAVEVKLKQKEGYYCVDSTHFAGVQKKSKGKTSIGCNTDSLDKDIQTAKVKGAVTLLNSYSTSPVSLVANSRLMGANGYLYRLDTAATIPGYTLQAGKIIPGSVIANITADGNGPNYRTASTTFSIEGFQDRPQYTQITGKTMIPLK